MKLYEKKVGFYGCKIVGVGILFLLAAGCSKKDSSTSNSSSQIPQVLTTSVSVISAYTAMSGGNCKDAGSPVTAKGVCWSTTVNPTIDSQKTNDSSGAGFYNSKMTGLKPNTAYFVRAYATNSYGTGYGNQQTFTTREIEISTLPVTNITSTTAVCGGNILSDGGGTVRWKAVHWDTISTLSSPFTNTYGRDEGGTGKYYFTVTNLKPNTTYYVKAHFQIYLNQGFLSFYGDAVSFTTLSK